MIKHLVTALVVTALLLWPVQAAALDNEDLLALVAMPLAVAAVSDVIDVPVSQLVDVVTLLNDAAVPPAQFIEVVRYVPVALVAEDGGAFVEFVRLRQREGLSGPALVNSIEERIHVIGIPDADLDVRQVRIIEVDADDFFPPPVRIRIAERKAHPHGGPPGQLKKQRGLQTGAEVVHGTKPGRDFDDDRPRASKRGDDDDRGKDKGRGSDGKDKEKYKEKDKGKDKGKGKG